MSALGLHQPGRLLDPLIRRLSSDNDHEVVVAVRKMDAVLKRAGLDFNDLADIVMSRSGRQIASAPASPSDELIMRLGECFAYIDEFNERGRSFLQNAKRLIEAGHDLTPKQIDFLNSLHRQLVTGWRARSAA